MAGIQSTDLKTELQTLLANLFDLGKEFPQCLYSLTQIVQPQIPNEMRIPLLGKLFTEVSSFLQSLSPQQLQQLVLQPRPDAVAFRLLLDIYQVQKLLQSVTYLQLLHLSNHTVPPGSPQQQLEFLMKIQEFFQYWSNQTLTQFHNDLQNTPLHLERQRLLQLEPRIPLECLNLFIELIKLPLEQLQRFKQWMDSLHREQLILLVNLLQMESNVLLELKRRIAHSPSPNESSVSERESLSGTKRTRYDTAKKSSFKQENTQPTEYEEAMEMLYIQDHPSKRPELTQHSFQSSTSLIRSSDELIPPPIYSTSFKETNDIVSNNNNNNNNINPNNSNLFEWDIEPPPLIGPELIPDVRGGGDVITSSTPPQTGISLTNPPTENNLKSENNNPVSPSLDVSQLTPIAPQPVPPSLIPVVQYQLRIAKQPPAKTVYQRILKPFPTIMLLGGSPDETTQANLFVEASLLRSDSDVELPLCLDGSRTMRISSGVFAVFKKLKILSTSQQQGTLFRLRFQLRRYSGTEFETIPNVFVISNPIEVFSHTQYLNEKKNAPPPPNVTEVLPAQGPASGNTRCVVLGSNFVNSPELRVKFGERVIIPTFHESGTLICCTPPGVPNTTVRVRVSNDGQDYCETYATFSYTS